MDSPPLPKSVQNTMDVGDNIDHRDNRFVYCFVTSPFKYKGNKGRFCNTIASVALVHTSIQSD